MGRQRTAHPKGAAAATTDRTTDTVLRFRASERSLHWAIAVPFLVCFTTAAVLVLVYNPDPSRPYRALFSWIHRISGVGLLVLPTLAFAIHRRDLGAHLSNIREAWVWTIADAKWLALMGLAAISSKFELPEQGKFNAAEKLNFMTVMTTYPLYIVTGFLIWMPGIAFGAWVVHVSIAALATPLVLGHIFMATINPDTRVGLQGMISGFVDRRWARHHYGRWFREQFEQPVLPTRPDRAVAPVSPRKPTPAPNRWIPATVRCPSCDEEHAVRSWEALARSVFDEAPLSCPGCGASMQALAVLASPSDLEAILHRLDRAEWRRPDDSLDAPEVGGIEPETARRREPARPHAYDASRWADVRAIPVSDAGTS